MGDRSQEQFFRPLEVLLRNEPADTKVVFQIDDANAEEFANALERNDYVTDIYLQCWPSKTHIGRWGSLLDLLPSRKNLKLVYIHNQDHGNDRESNLTFFDPILEAVQQNSSVSQFTLSVRLPGRSVASFLDATSFCIRFQLDMFIPDSDIPIIAAALARRKTTLALGLCICSSTVALMKYLESNNMWKRTTGVVLACNTFANQTITANTVLLPQILHACAQCCFGHLMIHQVRTSAEIGQIIGAIPCFKMHGLTLIAENESLFAQERTDLLLASVEQNFNLQCSVEVNGPDHVSTLSQADKGKVESWLKRNRRLAVWVADPSLLPKTLWPEALMLAGQAGHDVLYRSLRLVAPDGTLYKTQVRTSAKRKQASGPVSGR